MSYSRKCLLNISDSVPEFGANMAQVTLGKFFSGVPQIRELDGDSKKIYEQDLLIHGQKFLMDYRILPMEWYALIARSFQILLDLLVLYLEISPTE